MLKIIYKINVGLYNDVYGLIFDDGFRVILLNKKNSDKLKR
jgi:hypothetical protein